MGIMKELSDVFPKMLDLKQTLYNAPLGDEGVVGAVQREFAKLNLQEKIGEWSSGTKELCNFLRMFEPNHPNFRQRIDMDQLAAAALRAFE